ncbi:MAG: hypothetical protein K5694_04495 [Bacilli bacterium]|nr:hypothetical protein [Bacilli bacterium]
MGTILQGEEKGCGYSCLRMLLIHYSKNSRYRYIRLEGHPPYSLSVLKKEASREGMDLVFQKVSNKDDILLNKTWPILAVLERRDGTHMVYLERRFLNYLIVKDPATGTRMVKISSFIAEWSGVFGFVDSYRKQYFHVKKPKIHVSPLYYLSLIMEVVGVVVLYSGFYFVNASGNFLAAVIMFLGYGLISIFKQTLLVSSMKSFDKRYLSRAYDSDNKQFRRNYAHFYSYKKCFFSSNISFVSNFIMSFALSYLMCANNPIFLFSVLSMVVYAFVDGILISGYFEKRKKDVEGKEKFLFESRERKEEKIMEMNVLSKKAYEIGNFLSYNEIFYMAVSLSLSLIPTIVAKDFSLNYYLFHFFALLSIGQGLKKVARYFHEQSDKSREEEYFREYFLKKKGE